MSTRLITHAVISMRGESEDLVACIGGVCAPLHARAIDGAVEDHGPEAL